MYSISNKKENYELNAVFSIIGVFISLFVIFKNNLYNVKSPNITVGRVVHFVLTSLLDFLSK